MTTTANNTFARSFEDAALAVARFTVAATKGHWQRDLHDRAQANLQRTENDINRARRLRADKESPA